MHQHCCSRCGYVWAHSDDCALYDTQTFDEAHTCPSCRLVGCTEKYFGSLHGTMRTCFNSLVLCLRRP